MDPPTHPELLDWLAVEFMEHGWSMKHLHRLIVTSSVYRQNSVTAEPRTLGSLDSKIENDLRTATAQNKARDPANKFLWRMNPGQMEAEVVRDSLLHLADELDLPQGGYPLPNKEAETSHRRSLYFECFPEPGGQSEFATLFDPPGAIECYRRSKTIVPQQALALTNSRFSREQSRAIAQRLNNAFPIGRQARRLRFSRRCVGTDSHPTTVRGRTRRVPGFSKTRDGTGVELGCGWRRTQESRYRAGPTPCPYESRPGAV